MYIMKNRKHRDNDSMLKRFGFLIYGYKPNLYFWEFVIIYRKICMVLVSVFLSTVSNAV